MPKLIGEMFVAQGYATEEQIRHALRLQSQSAGHRLLGQILIEQGLISREQARLSLAGRESLLLHLIARINSTLDTEALLATIMDAAEHMMEAQASSLMLIDRKTQELVVTVPTGPVRAEILGTRIPRGQGFCGWVATRGEPLLVHGVEKDPRFFGDLVNRFRTMDLICVPLRNHSGEVIGVLEAINKRDGIAFAESEIPLFLALADHVAIALEKARLHREEIEKERLEQQLTWAKQIQEAFLRQEIPDCAGATFAAMNVPAIYVSGDYYDVIPIDAQRCALVIADVSGKGPSAALLMATFRAVLRSQVARDLTALDTVRMTNEIIVGDILPQSFITLFYGVLDAAKGELTYVNAGHNPPMLYDPSREDIELLTVGGTVIGYAASARYQSGRAEIRPDQALVMYTDGVTEARSPAEEFFGQDRLRALVLRHGRGSAGEVMHRIHEAVLGFTGQAPQTDDITLLVMKAR